MGHNLAVLLNIDGSRGLGGGVSKQAVKQLFETKEFACCSGYLDK